MIRPIVTAGIMAACLAAAPALAAGGRQIISTPTAPAAIGPYSQAVMANGTLYVSGQLGLVPETGKFGADDTKTQAEQALKNLVAILKAAGLSPDDVVMVQIYVVDLADYAAVNELYAKVFTAALPARAVVQVAALPRNARIEISLIATKAR